MEAEKKVDNSSLSILAEALDHFKNKRFSQVEGLCLSILKIEPENTEALNLLASCMLKTSRLDKAIEYQERAVDLAPGNQGHLKNLELIYRKNKQYEKALETIRKALEFAPGNPTYKYCEGLSLCHLWRVEEATEIFKEVVAQQPNHIKALVMLGNTLQELGRYEEAMDHFNQAFYIDHNNVYVLYNRSLLLLLMGDFKHGFRGYEARWRQGPPLALPKFVLGKPRWDGKEFHDRKLMIMMEQGHGDTIQFCRYLPYIKELGENISVLCSKNLIELVRPILPEAKWFTHDDPIPEFDTYATMMSLPLLMGTEPDSIPAEVPYLSATEKYKEKWKNKIKENGKLKVGLCWSGSKNHPKDHIRSIKSEQIKLLLVNHDVDFYTMEKGRGEDDAKQFTQEFANVIEFGSKIEDFSDSAAIIEQMDLIITVDTAVAHLAGAMAKPVWTMLLFNADWRWLIGREDSPWYPTMKLFRQKTRDEWKTVLDTVAQELKNYKK